MSEIRRLISISCLCVCKVGAADWACLVLEQFPGKHEGFKMSVIPHCGFIIQPSSINSVILARSIRHIYCTAAPHPLFIRPHLIYCYTDTGALLHPSPSSEQNACRHIRPQHTVRYSEVRKSKTTFPTPLNPHKFCAWQDPGSIQRSQALASWQFTYGRRWRSGAELINLPITLLHPLCPTAIRQHEIYRFTWESENRMTYDASGDHAEELRALSSLKHLMKWGARRWAQRMIGYSCWLCLLFLASRLICKTDGV